ncbi:DUF2207 domain-containing protein [Streptococcus oralis]|uniref:DUF2207 domain-containing protein n=1 Tax=Streptococcus oralis TaxID=1303 RepID=UPI000A10F2C6|nr:DUF2207 domain-containing protein [Streptococcus oralis]ORO35278.1 threonine dehydratase [Streptococcus oralis subsp. tigurinus]
MKKRWLVTLVFACLLFIPSLVFAVDFDILSYQGDLNIHADNTAIFKETITYRFEDDYNGQLVGLGKAGKMPEGFDIDPDPTVQVSKNGQIIQNVSFYTMEEEDGYKVKIYNAGYAGDTVRVTVTWKLSNLLFLYRDIAELNWQPLTDSSGDIKEFEFKVSSENPAEKLYFHTGKLFKEASVKKVNDFYQVKMKDLPRNRQVELHAYWPRSAFSEAPDQGLVSDNLIWFKRVELEIASEKASDKIVMMWLIPIVLTVLLFVGLIFYKRFKKEISPKKKFAKNHRLYEPPMDWPPMVLAESVYSLSLGEMKPGAKGFGRFTFERVIQATLLDLVDRGHLAIKKGEKEPILKIINECGLANFEKECLTLCFSDKKELAISDLFSDYQVSPSIYRGVSKKDAKQVQEIGKQLKRSFDRRISNIEKRVKDKVHALRIPNYYRPLSTGEKKLSLAMWVGLIGSAVGSWLFFYCSWNTYGFVSFYLLFLGLLASIILVLIYVVTYGYYDNGVLTDEGAEVYYLWTSFENMLRDIAHLDKAVLESIVVWNRLLVYATLFGYADKVSHLMRSYQIQVENPDINLYVAYGWHSMFYHSTAQMSHYASIANTASNYSVSSGSGSSGGGFSGGGGGGSIGAF